MGQTSLPKLGLIGFGAFGRLVARELDAFFEIFVCDPTYAAARLPDGRQFRTVGLSQVAACDVVVLAVPVARMPHLCRELAPLLRPGTLVLDVGSVKIAPIQTMLSELPEHVEIVGTHPLFGPQSAPQGVQGRKIVICPVRGTRWRNIAALARRLGMTVIKSTAEDHDREAATVQGLTHLIAKVLSDMGPMPQHMTTASFDLLRQAVGMVQNDPPTVLHAIETANPFAAEVRAAFFERAEGLRQKFEAVPAE